MVPFPPGAVPDRIAIEVSNEDGPVFGNATFIVMNSFPHLCYVLAIGILRVIGPDAKKGKAKTGTCNFNGKYDLENVIVRLNQFQPEIAIGKYSQALIAVLPEPYGV